MALTISVTDWTSQGANKNLSIQALLTSKFKIYTVKVLFGAGDNYATSGVAANLKADGRISTIISAIPAYSDAAVVFQYNRATGKILMYGSNGAGPAALLELGAASPVPNSKTFEFLVIGV